MHPPHLAVVRELVDRGHRVTYLVGTHLADLARPTGADVIGFDSLLPGSPAVLRIADAFVSHAGMGSCTEALWYGVPTRAIPQGVDQPANAAQLEVVGVGRHLTADPPTPDEIHDAILEVAADPKMAAPGRPPRRAADAVEDVATGRW